MSRDPERYVDRTRTLSELEGPSPELDLILQETDLSPEALLSCDEELPTEQVVRELGFEELRVHFPDLTEEAFEELVDAELLLYLQEHLDEFLLGEEKQELEILRELQNEGGESLHSQVRRLVGGVSRPRGADSFLDQLVTHIAAFIKAFEVRLLKKLKRADKEAQLAQFMEQGKRNQLPLSGRSIRVSGRGMEEEEEDKEEGLDEAAIKRE